MLDFQEIKELSFVTLVLDEMIMLDNGMLISKENVCEFINNFYDT